MRFFPDSLWSPLPLCCAADWIGLGVVALLFLMLVLA